MNGLSCTDWRRDVADRIVDGLKEGARLQFWVALAGVVLVAVAVLSTGGAA